MYVGVQDNPGFIDVWNATVPTAPVLLGQPSLTGLLVNMAESAGDLVTIERIVADPANTIRVIVYDVPCGAFTEIGSLTLNPYANVCGFATASGFGYLGGIKAGNSTLAIIDLTVPAAPTLRGELTLDAGFAIACEQIVVDGDFAYLCYGGVPNFDGGSNRFYIVNISDPDVPVLSSKKIVAGQTFYGVAKRPSVDVLWLLTGTPLAALVAYDVSVPTVPALLSTTLVNSNTHAVFAVN